MEVIVVWEVELDIFKWYKIEELVFFDDLFFCVMGIIIGLMLDGVERFNGGFCM